MDAKNKFHFLPKIITRGNCKLMGRDITLRGETTFLSLPRVFPPDPRRKRGNKIRRIFFFSSLLEIYNTRYKQKDGGIIKKIGGKRKQINISRCSLPSSNFQFPGRGEYTTILETRGGRITGLKVSRVLSSMRPPRADVFIRGTTNQDVCSWTRSGRSIDEERSKQEWRYAGEVRGRERGSEREREGQKRRQTWLKSS